MSDKPVNDDADWRAQIEELRVSAADFLTPEYGTDYNLLRWVRAWKGDMKEIMPRLERHTILRRVLHMDNESFGFPAEGTRDRQLMVAMREAFGFPEIDPTLRDRQGNILMFYTVGDVDWLGIAKNYRSSDYMWINVLFAEYNQKLVRAVETECGHPAGVTIIEDIEGMHIMSVMQAFTKMNGPATMRFVQDHFPEQTAKFIIINAPRLFSTMWKWTSGWLNENTQRKFHIISGEDWREQVANIVDPQYIPSDFGTRNAIQTVSKWPSSLDIAGEMPDIPVSDLSSYSVKPHRGLEFRFQLTDEKFNCLKWFFEVNSGVLFGIDVLDTESDKWFPVIPRFELSTALVPEWGNVALPVPKNASTVRVFRVNFVNCSTKVFAAKVKCWIALKYLDVSSQINGVDETKCLIISQESDDLKAVSLEVEHNCVRDII